MKTDINFQSHFAQFFLGLKIFQTKFVEKLETNTHFTFNNFFFENHVVYEITWKNTVEQDRPQVAIRCVARWIPTATTAHTGRVILTAFPLQQWLHGHTSTLRYFVRCLSCYHNHQYISITHDVYNTTQVLSFTYVITGTVVHSSLVHCSSCIPHTYQILS